MSPRLEILSSFTARAFALPLSLLHRACFADAPWEPKAICEIAGLAGFFGVIAWGRSAPAGFAFAFGIGEECEIAALGVVPQRRRMGIGAAMLDAICRETRRRGAGAVVLEVASDNAGAVALYTTRGFVRFGERRGYYRRHGQAVDAQLLRLTLVDPLSSI